jgi:Carboxypeptidase regulatory-like domain/TonB dependent receptor-like, beta-barrel/TonB-dependent Receptor Plug Domain
LVRVIRNFSVVLFFAALLAIAAPSSQAQNAAGRIVGNVTDPSGAAVVDASVTVINIATQLSQHATTDKDGFYQVLSLPIGAYRVIIEKEGFHQDVFDNQVLQINQSLRVDAKLTLGQKTEVVEVHEQAGGVETVNQTVGGTIVGEAIQQAPLNGRNALNLALLQPGVTESNDDNTSAGNFSIAGGRTDSVTYLLDGGLNNNLLDNGVVFNPNPDTIAEFRVLESNYSAEYGRNGGGIVSVVTKSGTNSWHASAFDFLRNDALNANTFINNFTIDPVTGKTLPRDVLKRNQYGGTFGGPITIPHLVRGKDRFFFFVGYQGQRLTQNQTNGKVTVFTPDEVTNGNFNGDPGVVAFLQSHPGFQPDPTKAAAGIIDPAMFNPVAVNMITKGLIPESATGSIDPSGPHTDNDNELTMKFDFSITDRDKITATIGGFRRPVFDTFSTSTNTAFANVPGYPVTTQFNDYFVNLAYTRTINPNLVNEVRFVTQRDFRKQATPASTQPTPAQLGFTITPDSPSGPPIIEINSNSLTAGFTFAGPTTLVNNTFGVTDTLSWVRGKHNFKMGAGFSGYQNNQVFDFIINGSFNFDGGATGNGYADFLLGIPTFFQQGPAAPSNIRSKSTYGFFQDEWRATKRLTLTMGLRYEYNSPKYDTEGRTFSVIPGLQSTVFPGAPTGLVFPGDKGAPNGVNFPVKNNWAPRLGFAWDPQGDGKTSVRGGFGIFYDILKAEDNFQFNGQPPFFSAAAIGFPDGTGIPANQSTPLTFFNDPFGSTGTPNTFPSQPINHNMSFANILPFGGGSLFFVDPHLKTPYTYQYNLSVQREVARNTVLEVNYLGSSSHGLTGLQDVNPFKLGTTDRILNLGAGDTTCPDAAAGNGNLIGCSLGPISEFRNVTKASYNALVASLTKQIGNSPIVGRTYFTLGYTLSHEIDNVSGFRQRNSTVPSIDSDLFRASGDTDVRSRITFSGGWDLPFEHMWQSGPKKLTQGWSLFPIVTWRTGFPIDVAANLSSAFTSGSEGPSGLGDPLVVHANVVGPTNTFNPKNPQDFGQGLANYWFNPNSFSNAQCPLGSASTPGSCVPGPAMFPSDDQVVQNPSLATYGTLPRNSLRGPGRTNFDLALSKTTALYGERLKLEFRAEFFNIFNHTEFNNPDTDILSPTFGQILTTADPRIIQLALRLSF